MSRPLRVIPARDGALVLEALRSALAGGDPIAPVDADAAPASLPAEAPHPVAIVVSTSGSTGTPKRVALSAAALLAGAAAAGSALGAPGQWLLALPAHYIAGINVLTRSITAGRDPVILDPGPFDVAAFARATRRLEHDIRYTSLVPVQLARLLDDTRGIEALRCYERVLVGGQATSQPLLAQTLELGISITCTYGASETAGGCVYDGVPLHGVRARVVDGELQLAGPVLAEGYLGDAELTVDRFVTDEGTRWYRTGDLGTVDDGIVRVTGRADDQIVSGGINVSLSAVERVVHGMPGLADAVVVAAPSEQWGEVPVVVGTASVDLAAVRERVKAALGKAAAPAAVAVVGSIPRLPSGKPDRRVLAAIAARAVAAHRVTPPR